MREADRKERRFSAAMLAGNVMPAHDRKRLRVETNSDRILRLEAAYNQAQRDVKRRLAKASPVEPNVESEIQQASVWQFLFEISSIAETAYQAKWWTAILLNNQKLRARGKGQKTCPHLKALFDYLAERGFLCYDKTTRIYQLAPRYGQAIMLMRKIETDILNELFRVRPPIRDR